VSPWQWIRQQWIRLSRGAKVEPTKVDPCDCQPLEIPDTEFVARALFYSFHVNKKGKLKWQAFKPDRGENDLSVMRTGCLSASDCKRKAKRMETTEKHYRGFALLNTRTVRDCHFGVRDSREVFCGHADILLGIKKLQSIDGEPPEDPALTLMQEEAGSMLLRLSHQRMDSAPAEDQWPVADLWWPTETDIGVDQGTSLP
jgi:hypothetical protein